MREATKKVYYCEFCKKKGMQRPAMEKHELHCTLNPNGTCRWHVPDGHPEVRLNVLTEGLLWRAPLEQKDIEWLRAKVGGCPACMLAALRQSGVEYHHDKFYRRLFDYETEVKEARDREREKDWIRDDPVSL